MARDVVQRLLEHAVDVDADRAVHRGRTASARTRPRCRAAARPSEVPLDRVLEPRLVEDRRMERLRQAADVVQRRLRQLADLAKLGAQRRALRRVRAGAAQHRSHRGQNLAELVVQLARDLVQRRFPRGDQLLRELAALRRQRREPARTAAGSSESDTGSSGRSRRVWRRETSRPAAAPGRRCPGRARRSALRFRCSRRGGARRRAERRLTCLQRQPNLRARVVLVSAGRQRKHPIDRVPELCDRRSRYWRCSGVRRVTATSFSLQRVVEIDADALELRRPRRQRIRLVGVEHVAHRQAERDSDRSGCGAAGASPCRFRSARSRLQLAQAGDLPRDTTSTRRRRRSVTIRPSSSAVVGDRPFRPALLAHVTTPRGTAFPLPDDQIGGRRHAAELAQERRRSDPDDSGCASCTA